MSLFRSFIIDQSALLVSDKLIIKISQCLDIFVQFIILITMWTRVNVLHNSERNLKFNFSSSHHDIRHFNHKQQQVQLSHLVPRNMKTSAIFQLFYSTTKIITKISLNASKFEIQSPNEVERRKFNLTKLENAIHSRPVCSTPNPISYQSSHAHQQLPILLMCVPKLFHPSPV